MTPPIPLRAERARWLGFVALVLVAGFAVGWFLRPPVARYFDYGYALISPLGLAALCIGVIAQKRSSARWLGPLLLLAIMLSVLLRPHNFMLSAIGVASGLLAIASIFVARPRLAVAATTVCGASITASLLGAQFFP